MKKFKLSIILTILSLIPLTSFAQLNFNIDELLQETNEPEINLNSLKLVWSAETYAPYRYKGRPLPTQGSNVVVDAIIDISGDNPNNLKYSWFLDDVFQENKSGYAKTSFEYRVRRSNGETHTVLLKVFNESHSFAVEKSIEIPITSPEIVLCFSNGSSFSSDRKIKTVDVSADKKSFFIVRPYFFNITKLTDLNFEWTFANQEPIDSSAYSANILDLLISGKTDEGILQKSLSVTVTNKSDSRQSRSQSALVNIH